VSYAAITLCVASQREITKVSVYFVIDSVRKRLDTPSYVTIRKVAIVAHVKASKKPVRIIGTPTENRTHIKVLLFPNMHEESE